ncbi:MAG: endopeptidase La [Alphaproteobacteria bacterium]|nr:endopeptidase La [Alphaproteobacteria bacterium]
MSNANDFEQHDAEALNHIATDKEYPVLALRDMVVFPENTASLFIGRTMSLKAAQAAYQFDVPLVLLTQKQADIENPTANDLYHIGTIAKIRRYVVMPDGTLNLAVQGIRRIKVHQLNAFEKYYTAFVEAYDWDNANIQAEEINALASLAAENFKKQALDYSKMPKEMLLALNSPVPDVKQLVAMVVGHLEIKTADKQALLESQNEKVLLEKIIEILSREGTRLEVEGKIKERVRNQMEKNQREYYLNEQMKAIQKELSGTDGEEDDEISAYQKKINTVKLSKEAKTKAVQELHKLKASGPMSPESTVIRNYLDWLLNLPWGKYSAINHDLKKAINILDEDHFGLEKVKDRIIEYLAVQTRSRSLKSPILCLVGAPGVGKTSLGRSIARATGRHFVRASLGGMRDEAEIRGHRRTYIGAMPGKIIQSLKKAGTSNPLFLLDEIDKLGADWRGDPSSALLEVLDPEQNSTFNDHYLDVDYDLSKVMFVTTANSLNMPRPLLDRMEIIHIDGYTEQEKVEIAKRHLIPKVFKENAVKKEELIISDAAIVDIVRYYTSESGVRNLERKLASIARKCAKDMLLNPKQKMPITVDAADLNKYLGVRIFHYGVREEKNHIGVTTGLAWTEVGGDMLFIEAVDMPGKGQIKQTGKLGDVMKESIDTAYSVVRSHAPALGIQPDVFDKTDVHVHVPEGATPKDGPSAGVTMYTTLVSVFTKIPVKSDVAMTGEITLQGRVLPIGGLKEKLLSALRGGIKTVIIPKGNEKDLAELPDIVKKELNIVLVENASEVLSIALECPIKPLDIPNTCMMRNTSQPDA